MDANNPAEKKEDRDSVNFEGPTDSVYLGAPQHVELDVGTGVMGFTLCLHCASLHGLHAHAEWSDLHAGAAVAIDAKGWPDVVVWSPWTSMDCYKHFVCVENASFKPIAVEPGSSWRAQTEMDIVDL